MKNCVFSRYDNVQKGISAIYELTYNERPYTVELVLKKGKPHIKEIGAFMNAQTENLIEAKNYLKTELLKL